jgi:hypothetical protein
VGTWSNRSCRAELMQHAYGATLPHHAGCGSASGGIGWRGRSASLPEPTPHKAYTPRCRYASPNSVSEGSPNAAECGTVLPRVASHQVFWYDGLPEGSPEDSQTCGGAVVIFEKVLTQAIAVLQRLGRISYRTLTLQFALDADDREYLKNAILDPSWVFVTT